MARKSGGSILQEELYPAGTESARDDFSRANSASDEFHRPASQDSPRQRRNEIDDARLVDLDVDEESPFLRGQKRVSARRGALPKKTASILLWASAAAAILCIGAIASAAVYSYGEHSWRFRIESSDNIDITGMRNVTKAQIMEVMGADIGRNIFFVPLSQQQTQLEQIPWVQSASVMRFVPNRLKVEIHERTPVAFARVGQRISLIDGGGTLMDLPKTSSPHAHKYSFPVILGMNPGEPLSTRAPRMNAYNELVEALDSGGAHYSQDLSEVDLSDLDNLKIRVNDPAGDVLVELGNTDYLKRYKTYISHVQEWRQQFTKLESVNLRYDNQAIVNPDMEGRPKPALNFAKASAAVGVKPAALVTPTAPREHVPPKPAFELSQKTLDARNAARKPAPRAKAEKRKPKARVVQSKKNAPQTTAKNHPSLASSMNAAKSAASQKPAQSTAKATTPRPSPAIAKPSAGTSSN
jgi:cell division protein FtsQ